MSVYDRIRFSVVDQLLLDEIILSELSQDWPRTLTRIGGVKLGPSESAFIVEASLDSVTIGFCLVHKILSFRHPFQNRCILEDVWVRRKYRSLGIGRRLVEVAFDNIKRFDAGKMIILCHPSLSPFYSGVGGKVADANVIEICK